MKMLRLFFVLALMGNTLAAHAEDQAGVFDYYVLSLSWSPNWCDRTGNARGSAQCAPDRDLGWILHGLWPQYETGWPSSCATDFDTPGQAMTQSMSDIMGTAGLAAHEWRKHGACSGLDPRGYFDLSRTAFASISRPTALREITQTTTIAARDVEAAFLRANPQLSADQITITCRAGQIEEARICLTKNLTPRDCGQDVIKDCTLSAAILHPIP